MKRFNPRLPGGRRHLAEQRVTVAVHVSIHAFRGEGDKISPTPSSPPSHGVSIHAFRGEGDEEYAASLPVDSAVSIHAFRGEGDHASVSLRPFACCFNPRLPGGRRHHLLRLQATRNGSFNPRLPGGRRPTHQRTRWRIPISVSIHAFRGEGDAEIASCRSSAAAGFNPRLPGGRRPLVLMAMNGTSVFQSTPSGGKATAVDQAP